MNGGVEVIAGPNTDFTREQLHLLSTEDIRDTRSILKDELRRRGGGKQRGEVAPAGVETSEAEVLGFGMSPGRGIEGSHVTAMRQQVQEVDAEEAEELEMAAKCAEVEQRATEKAAAEEMEMAARRDEMEQRATEKAAAEVRERKAHQERETRSRQARAEEVARGRGREQERQDAVKLEERHREREQQDAISSNQHQHSIGVRAQKGWVSENLDRAVARCGNRCSECRKGNLCNAFHCRRGDRGGCRFGEHCKYSHECRYWSK